MNVLVVGAGIGGLTAAIALRRLGLGVVVAEQAPALTVAGSGITIQANAHAVFRALGITLPDDDIVPIGSFEMVNAQGMRLMSGDAADMLRDPPSVNVHRADLSAALCATAQAAGAVVRFRRRLVGVSENEAQVQATFSDGTTEAYDLVVGADGIHSATRRCLFGKEHVETRYAGMTCWRFAAAVPGLVPTVTTERWTPGRRAGIVPLSRERVYVYLVETAPAGTPGPGTCAISFLQQKFGVLDERLQAIFAAMDPDTPIHHGDLCDQPEVSFGRGRVVLLGDAAHATTPNMGQGAGLAIEDAGWLALLLKQGAAPEALPAAMQAKQGARAALIQKRSWQVGQLAHVRWGVSRWFRDRMLRVLASMSAAKQAQAVWAPGLALAAELDRALRADLA